MGQNFLLFCHRVPSLMQQTKLVDLVGCVTDGILLTNFGVVDTLDIVEGGEQREMELDSGDRIEEKDG
jgi:hypothetical protein